MNLPAKKFLSVVASISLHSGHIAFLQEAARFSDVYVALGSDRTVYELRQQANQCWRTPLHGKRSRA
jgi:glycerol-3-phosphate cytidylyltransferase-like family protein